MGTSVPFSHHLTYARDHPHACGDKLLLLVVIVLKLGSSPRVWGQVIQGGSHALTQRIIPTRVGTSSVLSYRFGDNRDHPHACGDKLFLFWGFNGNGGSSPRVWGQETLPKFLRRSIWIIPTRVGTSFPTFTYITYLQDHPHACGDKQGSISPSNDFIGSSPRVWGQVIPFSSVIPHVRIIPTRVGTRLKKSRKIAVLQNQPLRFPLTFHRSFV